MMNSLWWWLIPSKGRFESLVLPFQFQLSWWDPEDTLHVSFLSVFPPHPVPCAEIGNQHMVSAQCLYAGCMPDLIPDGSLSEPHHHKKRNTTLPSSSCFYISLDSIKRSWFFFFTWISLTAIEGLSALLFHGGNTLVTPQLFLEPHATVGADLRHHSCPAKLGLRVLGTLPKYWLLVTERCLWRKENSWFSKRSRKK